MSTNYSIVIYVKYIQMIFDKYTLFWLFYVSVIQLIPRYIVHIVLKSREKEKIITPQEGFDNMSLEISSWDFCARLFFICLVSFRLLYLITDKYSDYIIIKSRMLIPLWLFITGSFVRFLYYIWGSKRHWKHYKMLTEEQKQIFWVAVPIIVSIVFLYYDKNLSLMIIAILIGKFMWLDFALRPKLISDIIKFIQNNSRILAIARDFGVFVLFGAELSISFVS